MRERINPETKFQNSQRRSFLSLVRSTVKGLKRTSSRGSFGPIEFHPAFSWRKKVQTPPAIERKYNNSLTRGGKFESRALTLPHLGNLLKTPLIVVEPLGKCCAYSLRRRYISLVYRNNTAKRAVLHTPGVDVILQTLIYIVRSRLSLVAVVVLHAIDA